LIRWFTWKCGDMTRRRENMAQVCILIEIQKRGFFLSKAKYPPYSHSHRHRTWLHKTKSSHCLDRGSDQLWSIYRPDPMGHYHCHFFWPTFFETLLHSLKNSIMEELFNFVWWESKRQPHTINGICLWSCGL